LFHYLLIPILTGALAAGALWVIVTTEDDPAYGPDGLSGWGVPSDPQDHR